MIRQSFLYTVSSIDARDARPDDDHVEICFRVGVGTRHDVGRDALRRHKERREKIVWCTETA